MKFLGGFGGMEKEASASSSSSHSNVGNHFIPPADRPISLSVLKGHGKLHGDLSPEYLT